MAYPKVLWQNSPSTDTPINAENLNHMDDQIALNDQRLTALEGAHVSSFNGRTGAVTPADRDYDIGQIAPLTGAQVGQVPVVTNIGTEEEPELVFRMGAGGGAGGHEIIASDGTQMPQEPSLFLKDIHTSDDSVHLRTELEMIKNIVKADLANLTEDGVYQTTDEEDVPIGDIEEDSVSVTADSVKTYSELLNDIFNDSTFDWTKIDKKTSKLVIGDEVFGCLYATSSEISYGGNGGTSGSYLIDDAVMIKTNYSTYERWATDSNGDVAYTSFSATKPTSGTKITLYYGTSSTIINLKTDARDCMMSDGVTSVADRVTWKFLGYKGVGDSLSLPSNFEELYVIYGRTSSVTSDVAGITIPKIAMATNGNTQRFIQLAFNLQGGKFYTYQGQVIVSNASSIKLINSYYVGTDSVQDVSSTSNIWVYYR